MTEKITDLDNTFSIQWSFGCRGLLCEEIEATSPEEVEETIDTIYKENDDILQLAILYSYDKTKACHTMEIPEIKWFRKEFLEPIKNNETAHYFDNYCSCDFEFVSTVVDNQNIHLAIMDKNDDKPILLFEHIISKDEFLQKMDKIFNEIYANIDKLIKDYTTKHNLTEDQRMELKKRLYEW